MPESKDRPDDKDDSLLDKVGEFLNRPLWGTRDDDDEAKPQAAAPSPPAAAPKPPAASGNSGAFQTPSSGTYTPPAKPSVPPPSSPDAFKTPSSGTYTPPSHNEAPAPTKEATPSDAEKRIAELEKQLAAAQAAQAPAAPAPAPAAPAERNYTVVRGDTLRAIAQRFYGNEAEWPKIYHANKDKIKNPDMIRVGQVFHIPD